MRFFIGPELRSRLREAATRSGFPESELVRRAVMEFLKRLEKTPKLEESNSRR
jgi:hypothetical protein